MKCPHCGNPSLDRVKGRRRGVFHWWCWKCEKNVGPAPAILPEKNLHRPLDNA